MFKKIYIYITKEYFYDSNLCQILKKKPLMYKIEKLINMKLDKDSNSILDIKIGYQWLLGKTIIHVN